MVLERESSSDEGEVAEAMLLESGSGRCEGGVADLMVLERESSSDEGEVAECNRRVDLVMVSLDRSYNGTVAVREGSQKQCYRRVDLVVVSVDLSYNGTVAVREGSLN